MMKISVTFRNGEGENWQKNYAEEKMQKLKKYLDAPAEAHVVVSMEKFRNVTEINLNSNGWNINAKEEAKDMRVALDRCVEKIEKQLKKQREKIRQHKPKTIRRAQEKPLNEEEIEEPTASKIMETRKVILKPMSFDEAIMEIEETNDRFVLYRDTSSENVSMIYRGDDGRYTLIETK
ncbi:MAG TPA: ribosome-associated translation inhibitor RaiA [Smithella sp.]|jgi:putative sigma-54 modulation protein|nr:ribosome-associated translation inhibitor RaiA [Smithella sp.]NMC97625.1 ribosome-associated translation inhibitor RaiA [Deltaproteobacteria bacterium]OQC53125.1 MAG: Ribosome-associated factor Y [Deltaproteobacteria bacterium ADurb.Bin022]HNQ64856.1 ribosome-associated translation inhibitor RaiA [Smithella sp.]HOE32755.1 ribosome-associated translation inhibitor RaiA [Smithella sp.]